MKVQTFGSNAGGRHATSQNVASNNQAHFGTDVVQGEKRDGCGLIVVSLFASLPIAYLIFNIIV